jgi:23S rRNA pseudouridine1911/1915/1917 synthase
MTNTPTPLTPKRLAVLGHEFRRLGGPVTGVYAGARVDRYLAKFYPFLSRAGWQKRIEDGTLLVSGARVKVAARLRPGDELSMYAPITVEPEVSREIAVLWESGGVMAVFKPGNLPMHENGPYRKNTFAEILAQEVGREWAAVHRLDRETSGIVLCAAMPALRASLCLDLEARRMRKEYLAIARGVPDAREWFCDAPIDDLKESEIRIKKWVVPGGLPAQTGFSVRGVGRDACLLHAKPITGRTNQIRIHAAYAGHVLFGDKLYHPDEAVFLEYFEHGQTEQVTARTGFPRLCLHAAAMEFTHPATGRRERVESALPPDMAGFWAELSG